MEPTGGDSNGLLGVVPSSSSPLAAGAGAGAASAPGPSLGKLLPLHCGHNNAYSEGERRMLLEHLALEG